MRHEPSRSPTNASPPTRRQFLGFLGLALLGPVLPAAPAEVKAGFSSPSYLGSVRELLGGLPMPPGWKLGFDALIESAAGPVSEWVLEETALINLLPEVPPLGELAGLLRARGVARACEATIDLTSADGKHAGSYGIDLTLFDSARQSERAWATIATAPPEAGYDPLPDFGDAAVLSRGGWSLPGKIFFRRANALVAVTCWMPNGSALNPAAAIDRQLTARLSSDHERPKSD